MKRMLNVTVLTLVTLLVLYLLLVAIVYFNQDRLMYFPSQELDYSPDDEELAYEDVWLTTADGVQIHGWFIPAPNERGTVLYFHGNGDNISGTFWEVGALHRIGLSAFFVDYRGYGQSGGTPSEAGLYEDAAAAWRYLTETRGIPANQIILMGHSLGGGVAAALAADVEQPPAGLVLMSTFTAAVDVGAEHYPFLPVYWLAHNRYPTRDRLPSITVPILITHGTTDRVIPFHHGRRLYDLASEPKQFIEIPNEGHYAGFSLILERYGPEVEAFLDSVLPRQNASLPTSKYVQ